MGEEIKKGEKDWKRIGEMQNEEELGREEKEERRNRERKGEKQRE